MNAILWWQRLTRFVFPPRAAASINHSMLLVLCSFEQSFCRCLSILVEGSGCNATTKHQRGQTGPQPKAAPSEAPPVAPDAPNPFETPTHRLLESSNAAKHWYLMYSVSLGNYWSLIKQQRRFICKKLQRLKGKGSCISTQMWDVSWLIEILYGFLFYFVLFGPVSHLYFECPQIPHCCSTVASNSGIMLQTAAAKMETTYASYWDFKLHPGSTKK